MERLGRSRSAEPDALVDRPIVDQMRSTDRPASYTPTCVAPTGTVAWPGAGSAEVRRSISRRMSFIGSPERTRGIASKLLTAGGEVVNHSSVFAFHGSGPAIAPRFRLRRTLRP